MCNIGCASNDELNHRLWDLVQRARSAPQGSEVRQKAIQRMISELITSGRIRQPKRQHYPPELYQQIYEEALQDLWLYLYQKIEVYDPAKASVITWVNMLLHRRFLPEAYRKTQSGSSVVIWSLEQLEQNSKSIHQEDASPSLTELAYQCIEEDQEGNFSRAVLQLPGYSPSFREIALRRRDRQTWKTMSQEWNGRMTTISSFYYRRLQKFSDQIRNYCREQDID